MSPLVRSLLEKRGVIDEDAASVFLKPEYERDTYDPFLLQGMDVAVDRLLVAIEKGERIAIYADFDCDGIPGAALLTDFFGKIAYANFEVYIPHRDREGYGFHADAIRLLAGRGVTLIITVDVGTTAFDSVRFAGELGVDVIVTDHHEIIGDIPHATAVLNPKLGKYPFRELCGAGVAFKFVCAALAHGKRRALPAFVVIPDGWEKWLLDLVAIATVADMVPLTGENRALVHFGLKVLRKSPRPGIRALCEMLRLRQSEIIEDDVSFSIAPRINAASRMEEPGIAFELLTTKDMSIARSRAQKLEELNASRKGVVGGIVKQARRTVAKRYGADTRVVVIGDPEWKPALLGLAANSIMQERGGVVCMWGKDGNGKIKGSCRSDGSISLVDLFGSVREHLEEAGGHERSGGFSVSHENVHRLPELLQEATASIAAGELEKVVGEDAELPLSLVTRQLFSEISLLAPFGTGNPKPVFRIVNASVSSVRQFGKEQNHVEVQLECSATGTSARAFEFFKSAEDFSLVPQAGMPAIVYATVEKDSYRGSIALRLVDIVPERA